MINSFERQIRGITVSVLGSCVLYLVTWDLCSLWFFRGLPRSLRI